MNKYRFCVFYYFQFWVFQLSFLVWILCRYKQSIKKKKSKILDPVQIICNLTEQRSKRVGTYVSPIISMRRVRANLTFKQKFVSELLGREQHLLPVSWPSLCSHFCLCFFPFLSFFSYLNISMYLSCFLAQVHHFLLLCLRNLAAGALK